ncbi:MAG TPA: hypothetical protein VF024_02920 [Solirubrobacteraceae bacterium]
MRAAQRPLSPGWVAGSVRARQMLARRIGEQSRLLAAAPSLEDALAGLSGTAYGRALRPGMDLAGAQRAVGETTLWHIRVLAGWAPPQALEAIRALAAWFELVNIEDRVAFLAEGEPPLPFALGALATAWTQIAEARTVADVHAALVASPWGDPGAADAAGIGLGLRLAWARRVLEAVDEAGEWAAGGAALLVARQLFMTGRSPDDLLARRPPGLGSAWAQAGSVGALRAALPAQAAWALRDVAEPGDLWRAEVAWWRRVEQDATVLAHAPLMGEPMVVGSVVLLGVDAWRTAAALESAARGGTPDSVEVFYEVA